MALLHSYPRGIPISPDTEFDASQFSTRNAPLDDFLSNAPFVVSALALVLPCVVVLLSVPPRAKRVQGYALLSRFLISAEVARAAMPAAHAEHALPARSEVSGSAVVLLVVDFSV